MIEDVVIEILDIAGFKSVGEAQLVPEFLQEIERMPLGTTDPRHIVDLLTSLNIGARIMGGEMAVLPGKDRQHVISPFTVLFLTEPAAWQVAVQFFHKIGPALKHGIVNGNRADDLRQTAGERLLGAQQRYDICPVGVEPQGSGCLHADAR